MKMYDDGVQDRVYYRTVDVYKGDIKLDSLSVALESWMDETDVWGECTEAVVCWCSDNGYSYDNDITYEQRK